MTEILRVIRNGRESSIPPKPKQKSSRKPTINNVREIWSSARNTKCLQHPELGLISPSQLRALMHGKPCACCKTPMVNGNCFMVRDKDEARKRGYIEGARDNTSPIYMSPRYTTLDHILPKSHYPHLVLEYHNLQVICLRCNLNKGTSYTYDIEYEMEKLDREFEDSRKNDI